MPDNGFLFYLFYLEVTNLLGSLSQFCFVFKSNMKCFWPLFLQVFLCLFLSPLYLWDKIARLQYFSHRSYGDTKGPLSKKEQTCKCHLLQFYLSKVISNLVCTALFTSFPEYSQLLARYGWQNLYSNFVF